MNNKSLGDAVLSQLFDPHTIRIKAEQLLQLAKKKHLVHFSIDEKAYKPTVDFIIQVITARYPKLDIPYHSRWRHFEMGGEERIKNLMTALAVTPETQGIIQFELVIISVLLDAGAGPLWRYRENLSGKFYSRSEGLALASLALYQQGLFSKNPMEPCRVDGERLVELSAFDLSQGLQVTSDNPLEGLSGRVSLLNQLGQLLLQKNTYFGSEGRLGNFYLYACSLVQDYNLEVSKLFAAVLAAFNEIWPTRLVFQGISLGDVGVHQALKTSVLGSEYIPFHKLSQWLTYSLIEPLEHAGIEVTHLDLLTGLPEYRNGGLLIDTGLLKINNPDDIDKPYRPDAELIVEWRGLTIALLDELAVLIRQELHRDQASLPLAKILQGGTWEAGRQIAQQKRAQGVPPIQIISDGTVF